MPRYIMQLGDYFMEWSTIVDAPVTFGMLLPEFREYYRDEYGRNGSRDLDGRLERVSENGTSSRLGHTPGNLMACNHAGTAETELTADEIYRAYCLREPIRDGWEVPEAETDGT